MRTEHETGMTCKDYLEGFSEYVDGGCTSAAASAFELHRAACEDCARYTRVWSEGTVLLQAFSSVGVDEDFHSRLEHRITGLRNEDAIARTMGSGGSTRTVLGIAAVLLVVAWSPLLFVDRVTVELPPITVTQPGPRPMGIRMPAISVRPRSTSPAALRLDDDLFPASHAVFRQYAPILQRYRTGGRPSLQQ